MDLEGQYDKIYRFCYYRTLNKEAAEDLTQETFLRFLGSNYREQGMEIRYLYTIARNLCIDESRKQKTEALSKDIPDESDLSSNVMETIQIRNVLMKLTEDERDLIIMRYVNEESLSDISKITGLSRFAVYRKLIRVKKEFIDLMEGGKDYE